MRQQTAKILCAASVGLAASLASTALTTTTAEARECLTAPQGAAPAGSHWFYRTDHANKRKCWYVRAKTDAAGPATAATDSAPDEDQAANAGPTAARSEAASAATSAAPTATPKPAPAAAAPLRPSIANARAEVHGAPEPAPMREAAPQPSASQFPAPLPTVTTASDASAASPQATPQGSPVDQRWADAHASDASAAATADASSKLRTAAQNAVAKGGTPANVAIATAGSAATLIAALLAALALAGLIVGGIFKFGRREPAVRRDVNGRPDIWSAAAKPALASDLALDQPTQDIEPSPPVQPVEPPSWIKAARQHQAPVDDGDEIEELLARAQKRPAA
ncbi:hypothetical protein LPW26_05640 [Rhodopseudomonas sp. HC1]|uniref:hypothetical protein n=1 Tax=Rhodopseudomonas infernalis TaxID=2897386 RepID=UPI001EE9525B|nr:hypothetical protein [Rhodopseudomonas infernalis]MCG6204109.1 hypothetical protein [Rhodopseudomonas infernalis]